MAKDRLDAIRKVLTAKNKKKIRDISISAAITAIILTMAVLIFVNSVDSVSWKDRSYVTKAGEAKSFDFFGLEIVNEPDIGYIKDGKITLENIVIKNTSTKTKNYYIVVTAYTSTQTTSGTVQKPTDQIFDWYGEKTTYQIGNITPGGTMSKDITVPVAENTWLRLVVTPDMDKRYYMASSQKDSGGEPWPADWDMPQYNPNWPTPDLTISIPTELKTGQASEGYIYVEDGGKPVAEIGYEIRLRGCGQNIALAKGKTDADGEATIKYNFPTQCSGDFIVLTKVGGKAKSPEENYNYVGKLTNVEVEEVANWFDAEWVNILAKSIGFADGREMYSAVMDNLSMIAVVFLGLMGLMYYVRMRTGIV